MSKYIAYTGLGAEIAPNSILELIRETSSLLAASGRTLRSGASKGCSVSFESGVTDAFRSNMCSGRPLTARPGSLLPPLKEIYLPYRGFENHPDDAVFDYDAGLKSRIIGFIKNSILGQEFDKIQNPYLIKDYVARVYQLLGESLKQPSKFLLCWSPDGGRIHSEVDLSAGQTSVSICLAEILKIPVFNLANEEDYIKITAWKDKMISETKVNM